MSAVAAPPIVQPSVHRGSRARAVAALARVEGRRLIRRPIFLAGALLSFATLAVILWNRAPVMHHDDVYVAASLFPLAAATYLAANLAASRGRRHGAEDMYEAAPLPASARTSAHLLSLAWPLAAAIVLTAAEIGYLKVTGGVWSPSATELAVGPMMVIIFGAFAVLVGRVAPSAVAGPVGLIGLSAVQIFLMRYSDLAVRPRAWGAFWVPSDDYVARELMVRPTGWHLLYLGGVAAVAIAVTRLRHGATFGRATSLAAAVALLTTGVWGQSRPDGRERRLDEVKVAARERLVCQTHDGIRYCAYRAYVPWISHWREAADGVLTAAPAARRGLEVRQSIASPYEEKPRPIGSSDGQVSGLVELTSRWGARFKAGFAELTIAARVAAWSVGLPASGQTFVARWTEEEIREYVAQQPGGVLPPGHEILKPGNVRFEGPCSPAGQARAIVALWLAGQATPDATNAFRRRVAEQPYGAKFMSEGGDGSAAPAFGFNYSPDFYISDWEVSDDLHIGWGTAEGHYAAQLLDRPADQVRRVVAENWAKLTDRKTTTDEAVTILGLQRLPTLEEQLRAARVDPSDFIRQMLPDADPAKVEFALKGGLASLIQGTRAVPCP